MGSCKVCSSTVVDEAAGTGCIVWCDASTANREAFARDSQVSLNNCACVQGREGAFVDDNGDFNLHTQVSENKSKQARLLHYLAAKIIRLFCCLRAVREDSDSTRDMCFAADPQRRSRV